ncbi:MAG: L,D-transpeptidase [Actinobacteria bacterium]|nr:L,D-transpeptidase [Actinomycetota bacterium]
MTEQAELGDSVVDLERHVGVVATTRRRRAVKLVALFAAIIVALTGGELLGGAVAGAQTDPGAPPVTEPAPAPPPAPAPAPPPSPFAAWPLPAGSGTGRRVVYSVGRQRVWWVESDGTVVNTYLVSGRAGTPSPGTYGVYSKSRFASSGSARMEYMIRFARGRSLAIGFHSIPTSGGRPLQSEAQLGTYRSHGCVRQRVSDAAALWNWAPVGTRVDVVK